MTHSDEERPQLFGADNARNRDMLEHQATLAFQAGNPTLAAAFAQAAGLYAMAVAISGLAEDMAQSRETA